MAGVNKVILIGNLGKDPEVKHLESGRAVANFSLATSETYKNKQGERVSSSYYVVAKLFNVWHLDIRDLMVFKH